MIAIVSLAPTPNHQNRRLLDTSEKIYYGIYMLQKAAFSLIFFLSFTLLPTTVLAQTRSAELKDRMQEKRETMKEKREEFKQKLQTIRDEKKKAVVERIDSKLSLVNERRTNRMSEHLERLSSILTKIKERAEVAKSSGKDTNAVDAAIASAEASLANAQSAVATQAAKEYVIIIDSETTLKNSVGKTTSQLQSDLQTVHKAVVDAKQAVQRAVRELAKLGRL